MTKDLDKYYSDNSKDKIYIIGDVHGCYKTLLALIKKLPKDIRICFVGDLIDRGENSKNVVEFIKSNNYDCILGNHKQMFAEKFIKIINNEVDEKTRC